MHVALSVKNKLGFINGSLPQPPAHDPGYNAWMRNNNVVISRLYNSVSKEILARIMYSMLAKDIWDDIKNIFSMKNGPRIYQLRKQLMYLHQGTDDVIAYYTKLKSIWEEHVAYRPHLPYTCGGLTPYYQHLEHEYVMTFLMDLNDSFSQVRGQILLSNPLPPISKVFSLIVQEETQKDVCSSSPSNSQDQLPFAVRSDNRQNSDPTKSKFPKKDRPICSHCNIQGHTNASRFMATLPITPSSPKPMLLLIKSVTLLLLQVGMLLPL
jgi:hypothetical protein